KAPIRCCSGHHGIANSHGPDSISLFRNTVNGVLGGTRHPVAMDLAFGPILLSLAQNIALTVFALAALPWLHKRAFPLGKHGAAAVLGLIFSIVAVLGMLDPVRIAPGVFIDGRSPLMALAGFIGGPLSMAVAAVLADGCRVWLGGAGALVGVINLTLAGLIGVGVRWWGLRRDH